MLKFFKEKMFKIFEKIFYTLLSFIILILVASFFCDNLSAEVVCWEFAGWFGGGTFPNITPDPNIRNRVYLVSDIAGIWKSENKGEKWIPVNEGLGNLNVSLLEVAPSDSNILYAGTLKGLYISKNQGKNWDLCNTYLGKISFKRPDSYKSISVSSKNPAKLVIGTKDGDIYCSEDFGNTWNCIEFPKTFFRRRVPITFIQFDLLERGIYVAVDKEFYYYSFENDSWELLVFCRRKITDVFASKERKPLICLASGAYLVISRNGGKSWNYSKRVPEGIIYRFVVYSSGEKFFVAAAWRKGWHGGICLSGNGGRRWERHKDNFKFDSNLNPTRIWKGGEEQIFSLKMDPFDKNVLFATTDWGVFRSDNKGKTWHEKINGACNVAGSDIHITKEGDIYVATMDNGLLKSTDFGKSYQPIFPKVGYQSDINGHVWRVVTDPSNDKKVFATSSPWNKNVNQVIISEDGGGNFIIVRDGLPRRRPRKNVMWEEGYPRAIAFDPKQPHIMYLGIDGDDGGGIYVSHDGGWHWRYSKGQPGSKRIYNALAVDNTDSNRIFWGAYGKNGGVYMSENKGGAWQHVFKKMTKVFDITIDPEGVIYAGGDCNGPSVFVSRDHGKTWTLLKKFQGRGAAEALFIYPEDPEKMFVSTVRWHGGSGGKIYVTLDGGQNWKDITSDLPLGSGISAIAYNPKDNHLYVLSYSGSIYKANIKEFKVK